MKKSILTFSLLVGLVAVLSFSTQSHAQFGIGLSTEFRNEAPTGGYGVRIERYFSVAIAEVGARLHLSYFEDDKTLVRTTGNIANPITFSEQLAYDYGIAAMAKIKILPMFNPYVTLGIGAETLRFSGEDKVSETAMVYTSSFGVEFSTIPFIKPFAEYRISNSDFEKVKERNLPTSGGRLMFGVLVRL